MPVDKPIRFEFSVPATSLPEIWGTIPVLLFSMVFGFYAFGVFQGRWRSVSIRDILPVAARDARRGL